MKILILKPSSLGDVIQALPVLRLLKRHDPRNEIFWWVDDRLAPLLYGDRDLTAVLHFYRKRWTEPGVWKRMWERLNWVRGYHFDLVIDLQCLARTAIFAWLARGTRTVGLDEPREGARGIYDRAVLRRSFSTHAVDWYLEVLRLLKVPVDRDFDWIPERAEVNLRVRQSWGAGAREWVLLQPGARWLNKRWPVANFGAAARELANAYPQLHFAVLGGKEDQRLGSELAGGLPPGRVLDLTGKLTLPEMVEWVRLSRLMISNDTGPMHVAAAVGTPVVALFGPTEPRRTGPYGQMENCVRLDLDCAPCMSDTCRRVRRNECLEALGVDRVMVKARGLLEAKRAGR